MQIPFINLTWQFKQIEIPFRKRLDAILEASAYIGGPDLAAFEKNFAAYTTARHAMGVANGTDALIIALKTIGLAAGDEVITIPNTFFATASAIVHAGGTPVFADIDPLTRNFDFEKLERAITPKTKAIIPVHLYGQPVDMEKVMAIAARHSLKVIEDACQAQGATSHDKVVGTIGDLGCFSFYPGKNLGALGEAGAIITNSDQYAHDVQEFRNHGGIKRYEHYRIGYNSRLDSIQAAALDEKLKHLDAWNAMRTSIADRFSAAFSKNSKLRVPPVIPNTKPVFHLYILELIGATRDERDAFLKFLNDKGVGAGIHYPNVIPLTPAYASAGFKVGDFPHAEALVQSIVSLPIFPGMTDEEVAYVIRTVESYFA
jgi:dTDP-4-amino-4,6-dideoxygalactose transaminase